MPRMREIAERAGTSLSTVSLVLNNRDSAIGISPTTRQRVLDAARELGYTPNLSARRLRTGGGVQPLALGLVMPFDERLPVTIHSSIGAIRTAADAWTAARGLPHADILIETYPAGELSRVHSLQASTRHNGALLFNTTPEDDAFLAAYAPLALSIVAVQRSIPGLRCVNVDNFAMGEAVAAHLLAGGHARFATIAPAIASQAIATRIDGFAAALAAAGRPLRPEYQATGDFSPDGGAGAAIAMLDRLRAGRAPLPSALFVAADTMAVGALHALKRAGLRIPGDIAVVGYDNDPIATYTDPPLTTVDAAMNTASARATAWLLDAIRGGGAPAHTDVLVTHLIVRESSGAHATPHGAKAPADAEPVDAGLPRPSRGAVPRRQS